MSRFTRKMLLLGLVGGLLPVAMASMVYAGAAGCTNCGVAVFDFNGDGKSDGAWEKTIASVLLRITALDNVNAPILTNFPFTTTGTELELMGAGHVTGAANNQASVVMRATAGANPGLLGILKINPATLAADGTEFPAIVPSEYSLIGLGDADGNGTQDFYFVKVSGPNLGLVRIYLTHNDGSLLSGDNFAGFLIPDFEALDVGDMDGDGLADVFSRNPNTNLYAVSILTAFNCLAPSVVCFDATKFPGSTNADYDYVGLAYGNDDDRTDVWTVKNIDPHQGLLRILRTVPGADGFMPGPLFPAVVPTTLAINGWGNYDGLNQAGIKARNPGTGAVRIWNFDSTGGLVLGTGFPTVVQVDFVSPWGSATTAVIP